MGVVVQKFGGSSVKNPEKLMEAARKAIRAKQSGHHVIVVVSAQGSTTDDLIAKAAEITASPSPREMDMLLATGEQISIALTALAIQELGEKAISFTGSQIGIVTDSTHRKARIKSIDTRRINASLETGHIVIVAGFQGIDELGDISTLGRGGSDTTAVAVAAAMKMSGADVQCEIYTDVDGVYTTDPRIVPDARKMDAISYDEMLEMASLGAGVMHSRSIEFAKKFDVPLMVRNSASDAVGTWILPEADWMSENPTCGVALAADEARVVLEGVPNQPGVSHKIFSALATANIVVDMIGQSSGAGGKATIGFTVIHAELERTRKTLAPIVQQLGALLNVTEKVSKVSVVGAGMRSITGVALRMFEALAADGVNLKMITTGDIKISVLIEEDAQPAEIDAMDAAGAEKIKKAHIESAKAVRGRKTLRTVHKAFQLGAPRKGAGLSTDTLTPNGFAIRPAPIVSADTNAREQAVARLDGMEDVLVSGVHVNREACRVTIHDLPDVPGHCARVFNAIARSGIIVDMIVQNITGPTRAELSFTVPRHAQRQAEELVRETLKVMEAQCRVESDADIAVVYVLGVGMRTHTGVARTMFGALATQGINIEMINTSEVCIGVVIDAARATEAEASLKAAFRIS